MIQDAPGQDLQTTQQSLGFWTAMGFHDSHRHIDALATQGLGGA